MVLVLLISVGAALATSLLRDKTYSVEASLLFRDAQFDEQLLGTSTLDVNDDERTAATNLRLVSLRVVAERTATDLDPPSTVGAVEDAVDVSADGPSDVINVEATADSPETAAQIANVFADNYIEFRREADRARIVDARRLVESDLAELGASERDSAAARSLQEQVSKLKAIEALQTGNAELVQPAEAEAADASPKVLRNAVLAAALGGILAVMAAFAADRLDRRVREIDEFADGFGLPVLATVPELDHLGEKPIGAPNGDGHSAIHSFLMLRNQLRYFNVDKEVGVIMVTSAAPGEGKTTIARHLAACASLAGEEAILVEADLHQPTLSARLDLLAAPGLSEYLSGQEDLESVTQRHEWSIEGAGETGRSGHVDVIAAGSVPPNPAELLESNRMEELVAQLRTSYTSVIVDTPPILQVADAIPLIRLIDGVLIVTRLDGTTDDQVRHLAEQIGELRAPALGVVVNHVRARRGYGYYGGYGYRYSSPSESTPSQGRT